MAELTGSTIADTYKQLLKITSEGVGADDSAKYIEDGLGTDTALSLSTTRVGIGTTAPPYQLSLHNSDGGILSFGREDTSTENNDVLGRIYFSADDPSDGTFVVGASIIAQAAGTWASSDAGAKLIFSTSSDGASSVTEKMRISDTGNVGIGVADPSELLDVNGTVRAKALRIDEAANVNEGTITNTSVAGYSRLKAATNSGGGSTGVLIKGLDGGVEGQVLYIYKTSNQGILRIYHGSANAAAGDRILVPGCDETDDSDYIEIPSGGYGGFTLVYDTSAAEDYWHLITSAPNAAITN